MESMTIVFDQHEWTLDERDGLPDDGARHELVDGALVMTPAPSGRHQWVSSSLLQALILAAPADLKVLHAPTDVHLDDRSVLQPDVLVVHRDRIGERGVSGPPLLAIEILSSSTRLVDRNMKLPRFERAGCPSFWLVDPDEPSLTAYDLVDGRYEQVAHVVGDQSWTATHPYAVTLTPAALLA